MLWHLPLPRLRGIADCPLKPSTRRVSSGTVNLLPLGPVGPGHEVQALGCAPLSELAARSSGLQLLKLMDRLTPERRSWNMSRIRGRDTEPERRVRSILHGLGYRFSLRRKGLPGKPDIALPARSTLVFVHGCFWHQHKGCANATRPKTHRSFWGAKLQRNVSRDAENVRELRKLGWRVITVWECELRDEEKLERRLSRYLAMAKEDRRRS